MPDLAMNMKLKPFSLNFLFGPRQVGKTTTLHLIINKLLEKNDPKSIFYYSCDTLINHNELGEVIDNYLDAKNSLGIKDSYIFLDEITMVKEWWRAIKNRIDRGLFKRDVVVVTGSASMELDKHKELFPGRRGNGLDYQLLPLSFSDYARHIGELELKRSGFSGLGKGAAANKMYNEKLKTLFDEYLNTGGFPNTIKDWKKLGTIRPETYRTYLDWVRGDWGRVGRSDQYMKEMLSYLLRARATPVSWNGISNEASINSPNTARSYMETLEGLYITLTLNHLKQDGRVDYKKNKKIHFTDPFLYKVFSDFTGVDLLKETVLEAAVASNLARVSDVYYWKKNYEIDVVCRSGKSFIGFEATVSPRKTVRKPYHLSNLYVLNNENAHLYLSALKS